MILIFVTTENKKDAKKLANYLIDKHLAACVNVFPVDSFYFWKGQKVNYQEYELIIKTKKEMFGKVQKVVETVLSYEISQIINVEVQEANKPYVKWLEGEIK